jgi:Holliday junction resolvasome RuvABC endonuclease subunit
MRILGVDPSITKLGLATIEGDVSSPIFTVSRIIPTPKDESALRFAAVVRGTITKINSFMPELVVVEYPFNIQGYAKVLIEVFGAIRYHCIHRDVPFLALEQSRLKKYATGAGAAEKSAMVMQVYKEYGLTLTEDEADAFWVAHMGMTYLYGSNVKHRQASIDDMRKKSVKKVKKVKLKK